MNGTARGRGRNSHGYMHVPASIDPWKRHGREHGPGKVVLYFRFSDILAQTRALCVNNGPSFPFDLTHAAAEDGGMVTCPGSAAVPPPHTSSPPAMKTPSRRVYASCARNDPSTSTNFTPDRQSLRCALG